MVFRPFRGITQISLGWSSPVVVARATIGSDGEGHEAPDVLHFHYSQRNE